MHKNKGEREKTPVGMGGRAAMLGEKEQRSRKGADASLR